MIELIKICKFLNSHLLKSTKALIFFGRSFYWLVPVSWAIVIAYISPRFGFEYSSDSYAYYLIGTNFTSGLGYASQAIRDFYLQITPEFYLPSRSFPPLMPILIGLCEKVFSKGISSGLLVNIFILLAMIHTHFLVSRKISGKYFLLIFLALPFFLIKTNFVEEVISGRSIPLVAFLYSLIILIISHQNTTKYKSLLIGILMGMLYLTRFDCLIFCLMLLVFLKLDNIKNTQWVVFGFLISIIPWSIRNIIVFGNPFASDNSITALSTYASIVPISWFEHIPQLQDNPSLWITQRITYTIQNVKILLELSNQIGGFLSIALSLYGLWSLKISKSIKTYITISWIWVFSNLITVSITPYHDARYFSFSTFLILTSALLTLISLISLKNIIGLQKFDYATIGKKQTQKFQLILSVFSLLLIFVLVNHFVMSKIKFEDKNSASLICLRNAFNGEINNNSLIAFKAAEHLAYYSNWRTIYMPLNLQYPDKDFISWKSKLNVSYAILPETSDILKHPQVIIKKKACDFVLADLTELLNNKFSVTNSLSSNILNSDYKVK
jgi:hypothetical protein